MKRRLPNTHAEAVTREPSACLLPEGRRAQQRTCLHKQRHRCRAGHHGVGQRGLLSRPQLLAQPRLRGRHAGWPLVRAKGCMVARKVCSRRVLLLCIATEAQL